MLRSRNFIKKLAVFPKLSRKFGSDHKSHSHGHSAHSEPYAVKHGEPYPTEAYPLGLKPGAPLEGWEIFTVSTFLITFGMMVFISFTREDESVKDWARREYLAREKVIENGGEIEFGKWYSDYKFTESEEEDEAPVLDTES